METYRGYTIDTESSEFDWNVWKDKRVVYVALSYDDALSWIDEQFNQMHMAQLSYQGY